MPGPLDGIRVIDLTAMASGPLATTILADQGADVVKVEPPGRGDLLREIGASRDGVSAIFQVVNRGKRSIVLDLADPRGLEILDELTRGADVFVQNFRPGVADRMKIGPARMRGLNRDLVYVSINGFGTRGPYADRQVYDSLMQAYSGIAAHQADPDTGVPAFVHNIVCDKGMAIQTAQAITAALFARERGAGGQHVELSMLHGSLAFLWPDGMQNHTFIDAPGGPPLAPGISRTALPPIRRTADGYMAISVIKDAEFRALCGAIGVAALAEDERFREAGPRARNARALQTEIDPVLRRMPTVALAEKLREADVPHAVVNALDSIHRDVQVVENALLVEIEQPGSGWMRMPRPLGDFESTPLASPRPAPRLGEHGDAILAELGRTPDERALLRSEGVVGPGRRDADEAELTG